MFSVSLIFFLFFFSIEKVLLEKKKNIRSKGPTHTYTQSSFIIQSQLQSKSSDTLSSRILNITSCKGEDEDEDEEEEEDVRKERKRHWDTPGVTL